MLDALAPILVPPLRCDGKKIDKNKPGNYLRPVLVKLGLDRPGLGWYEATRHTFTSQWGMAGGSIEKRKEILGHYSVVMTERYAHLRPDLFPASDLGRFQSICGLAIVWHSAPAMRRLTPFRRWHRSQPTPHHDSF